MREREIVWAPSWFFENRTFVFKNIVQSDPDGWLRKNQTCFSALPRVIKEMIPFSYKNSAFSDFISKNRIAATDSNLTVHFDSLFMLQSLHSLILFSKMIAVSKIRCYGDLVSPNSLTILSRF